jgi:hypothetical protein
VELPEITEDDMREGYSRTISAECSRIADILFDFYTELGIVLDHVLYEDSGK